MNQKLKIGVLGAGYLGKIHLSLLEESRGLIWLVFMTLNHKLQQKYLENLAIVLFEVDSLFDEVDVIDIVTPTVSHFELGKKALEKWLTCLFRKANHCICQTSTMNWSP